jgi:CheY-like chemotaxis protein
MQNKKQEKADSLYYSLFHEQEKQDRILVISKNVNRKNEYDYKKSKILIVDDNQFIQTILMEYLQFHGYQNFISACSAESGLHAVYLYTPDIIICDFNMPGMKGDQFHTIISEDTRFRHIPFIFLTALPTSQIRDECKKMKDIQFMRKPVSEDEMVMVIDDHLKRYMEYKKLQIKKIG